MTDAPVCHVPTDQQIDQPPPVSLPAIPQVMHGDWQSVINAVNAIRLALQMMAGQLQRPSLAAPSSGPRSTLKAPPSQSKSNPNKPPQWTELSRKTSKQKIYNPDDKSQFIELEQIDQLIWQNKASGDKIEWKR